MAEPDTRTDCSIVSTIDNILNALVLKERHASSYVGRAGSPLYQLYSTIIGFFS
jgi:hypothetical protein